MTFEPTVVFPGGMIRIVLFNEMVVALGFIATQIPLEQMKLGPKSPMQKAVGDGADGKGGVEGGEQRGREPQLPLYEGP